MEQRLVNRQRRNRHVLTPFFPQTCRAMDPTLGSFFLSDDCSSPCIQVDTAAICISCLTSLSKGVISYIIDTCNSNNSIIDHVWLF